MKLQLGILSGVFLAATLGTASAAQAALVVVPPGLAPGAQYRLVFVTAGTRDGTSDNIDDYVVLDPLLEAGKAKFNKQQNRAKKRQSEWAGKGQG